MEHLVFCCSLALEVLYGEREARGIVADLLYQL